MLVCDVSLNVAVEGSRDTGEPQVYICFVVKYLTLEGGQQTFLLDYFLHR